MAATKELYTILGVSETASDQDIRHAYNKMAEQYPEGTDERSRILRAYTVLSDMDSRARYDITGKVPGQKRTRSHSDGNGVDKARTILNTLFLAGAVVTTVLFMLQWGGSIGKAPFYWACGASMTLKVVEYILRLIP